MSDMINENSVRLAALELIVSEILAHYASADPVCAHRILKDAHRAKASSSEDSQDHAIFSLVSREFEQAIERSNEGMTHRQRAQA